MHNEKKNIQNFVNHYFFFNKLIMKNLYSVI